MQNLSQGGHPKPPASVNINHGRHHKRPATVNAKSYTRRVNAAEGARQEDVAQPTDGVEPGLEANVAPPPTEPNVILSETEQPSSSPVEPVANATG